MSANIPLVVRLLASSVTVAERAGKIVRDVMSKGELGIVEKGKDDYQTEADRSAQRCIITSLSAQYPKVTIIGEEDSPDCGVNAGDDVDVTSEEAARAAAVLRLADACPPELRDVTDADVVVWVDPLDGTNEYTQGALILKRDPWERCKAHLAHPFLTAKWYKSLLQSKYGFLEHVTVLIGIAVRERAVAGVIHQPYHGGGGRSVWGLAGAGVGGLTPAVTPSRLVVTTTRSHSTPLVERALRAIQPDTVLRVGGAGYKVLQLLEGDASVYLFASAGCKKWDTCAPEAVLASAGGVLTDVRGRIYRYGAGVERMNRAGVLAALTPALHARALAAIPTELQDQLDAR